MQMGEGARLHVANQKEVHQFAVIGNERRPSAATFGGVHFDFQNELVAIGAHLGRHPQRLVKGIVPVVAVLEIPPFLSAINQQRKKDGGQRQRRTTPTAVFRGGKRSRSEAAFAEDGSGNLQPAEEQNRSQR